MSVFYILVSAPFSLFKMCNNTIFYPSESLKNYYFKLHHLIIRSILLTKYCTVFNIIPIERNKINHFFWTPLKTVLRTLCFPYLYLNYHFYIIYACLKNKITRFYPYETLKMYYYKFSHLNIPNFYLENTAPFLKFYWLNEIKYIISS